MQRSTLMLVLVLAVILGTAALWFSLQDDSDHRGALLADPLVEGRPEAPARSSVDLESATRAGGGVAQAPAPRAGAAVAHDVRREAVPPSADAETRTTIQVRVIDGVTTEPVAGASVFVRFLTSDPIEIEAIAGGGRRQVRQEDVDRWDLSALDALVAGRPALRTDAAGLVSVPAPLGGSTVIVARHEERWGRRVLDEREPEEDGSSKHADRDVEELLLAPDQALVARVVDPLGQPVAAVPIQLESLAWSNWSEAWEVLTDETTGEARFEHVQLHFQRFSDSEQSRDWRLAVGALVPEPTSQQLDPENLPLEPMVFELARGGSVEVSVLDPMGELLTEGGRVTLGIVAEGQNRYESAFNRGARQRVSAELQGERTRFEHVAPGHELDVSFSRDAGNMATHVFTAGPARAGEAVRVDLTMGADHPIVRVRLLDATGEPVVATGIETHARNGEFNFGSSSQARHKTDATGHVLIELDAGWSRGQVEISRHGEELSVVLELDRELPDGLTDLGDVVLAPTPLIVSGRVVGPAREAIANAAIRLLQPGDDWNRLWELDTETDGDGVFEVHGILPGDRYRIQVQSDGYYRAPLEFDRGTSGLVVELGAAGAIVGSLLLNGDVPTELLKIRLDPVGDEPVTLGWSARNSDPDEDGSFNCGPLPAGLYRVTVQVDGGQETLVQVDDVVVETGRETRDPRLAAIDLRSELYAFKLTIDGFDKTQQGSGTVRLGEAGAEELDSRRWFRDSEIVLVAPHRVIDLDVEVPGFRTASLRGVAGDARVELQRGSNVRVVLVGGGEPLSVPYGLSVGFIPVEEGSFSMDWSSPRFDERREIVVRPGLSGPARVVWIVEKSAGGSAMATSSATDPEQVVILSGGSGEQRVEVRLTRDEAARLRTLLSD